MHGWTECQLRYFYSTLGFQTNINLVRLSHNHIQRAMHIVFQCILDICLIQVNAPIWHWYISCYLKMICNVNIYVAWYAPTSFQYDITMFSHPSTVGFVCMCVYVTLVYLKTYYHCLLVVLPIFHNVRYDWQYSWMSLLGCDLICADVLKERCTYNFILQHFWTMARCRLFKINFRQK